jgi:hypothetical protein
MRPFRIWHLGLAVLWVGFLSWLAATGRGSDAPLVLAFWVLTSAIAVAFALFVARPLGLQAARRID